MGDVTIEQQPLPDASQLYNNGKSELNNLRELKVGDGSTVFYTDKEGSRWGHIKMDLANAWIKTDGTAQFKTPSGQVLLSTNAIDGNFINVINNSLNTASNTILKDFTFEATDYAGAFKAGNPTWNEATGLITGGSGVLINARGILGANAGVATFTLDATTGNATFAGTLAGASGTFGTVTAGSISGVTISGSTISGSTVQTSSLTTGLNVKMDGSDNSLKFIYNNSTKGYLATDSNGTILLSGDNNLFLEYNNDGGTDGFSINNDGSPVLVIGDDRDVYIPTGGDLLVQDNIGTGGDIQCGGTFKSSDGSSGTTDARDIVMSVYNGGANYAYRRFTWKDGLLVSIGSEQTTSS